MFHGPRSTKQAAWHLAVTAGITSPVAPEPACSVSSTEHPQLDREFSYLMLRTFAECEERRGRGGGHVGGAHVREGGEVGSLYPNLVEPIFLHLVVNLSLPAAL